MLYVLVQEEEEKGNEKEIVKLPIRESNGKEKFKYRYIIYNNN